MPIDDAKAKLEAARTAIASRQAEVRRRREAAQHRRGAKASGGDLGWRTADNAMLGEKAVTDAVKTLKAGEMTPVIATDRRVPRDRRRRSAKAI